MKQDWLVDWLTTTMNTHSTKYYYDMGVSSKKWKETTTTKLYNHSKILKKKKTIKSQALFSE